MLGQTVAMTLRKAVHGTVTASVVVNLPNGPTTLSRDFPPILPIAPFTDRLQRRPMRFLFGRRCSERGWPGRSRRSSRHAPNEVCGGMHPHGEEIVLSSRLTVIETMRIAVSPTSFEARRATVQMAVPQM